MTYSARNSSPSMADLLVWKQKVSLEANCRLRLELIHRCNILGVPGEGEAEEARDVEEMQLGGWRWVCPGCRKEVKLLVYPMRPQTLFDYLGYDPARATEACEQSKE